MAGSSSFRIAIWIIALAFIVSGVVFGVRVLQKEGFFMTDQEIRDKLAETAAENEQLEDENSDLKRQSDGIPAWMWGVLIIAVILAFMFLELSGDGDGQNITMEEAIDLSQEWASKHHAWEHRDDNPRRGSTVYTRVFHLPGQKVEGDGNAWWYFISLVKYWPPGAGDPPGHGCLTFIIRSTDHKRGIGVVAGMNARQVYEYHKMHLQKSPTPTDLAKLVTEQQAAAKIAQAQETLGGGGQ